MEPLRVLRKKQENEEDASYVLINLFCTVIPSVLLWGGMAEVSLLSGPDLWFLQLLGLLRVQGYVQNFLPVFCNSTEIAKLGMHLSNICFCEIGEKTFSHRRVNEWTIQYFRMTCRMLLCPVVDSSELRLQLLWQGMHLRFTIKK